MVLGFREYHELHGVKKLDNPTDFVEKIGKGIKIHTLREDRNKVYKVGTELHMATGVRTKNYFCFNDSHIIRAIQEPVLIVMDEETGLLSIVVSRRKLVHEQKKMFISNDGFDNVDDFIEWFFPRGLNGRRKKTLWSGRLIHWTDYKY